MCSIYAEKTPPPSDFVENNAAIKAIEGRIGPQLPLLILGDHPILDKWNWLKLDRGGRQSLRLGVVWLPDNSLPPSLESQVRLMQLFTKWSVLLADKFFGI